MSTKELEQVEILNEYASTVETLSEQEMKTAITSLLAKLKAESRNINMGLVLKSLLGPGGSLEGKPVDKGVLSRLVKEMLS